MQLDLYGNRMLPASDSTLIKIDGKFNPTIHVNNNKKKRNTTIQIVCTKLSALEWIVVQMKGKVSIIKETYQNTI